MKHKGKCSIQDGRCIVYGLIHNHEECKHTTEDIRSGKENGICCSRCEAIIVCDSHGTLDENYIMLYSEDGSPEPYCSKCEITVEIEREK